MQEISTEIGDLPVSDHVSSRIMSLVRFDESILCAVSALRDWYVCLSEFLFKLDGIDFV